MEIKSIGLNRAELKAVDGYKFAAYVATWDTDSTGDRFVKGAFRDTLKDENRERPIRMRFNHFSPIIGKWLELKEDDRGLFGRGELTKDHSLAEDVRASLRHGAVDGFSIAVILDPDQVEVNDDDERLISRVEHLIEAGPVEEPANMEASPTMVKGVNEVLEACESRGDVELILRQAGFSRAAATALVAKAKNLGQRGGPASTQLPTPAEAVRLLGSRLFNDQ